jgi:hypothetical protein
MYWLVHAKRRYNDFDVPLFLLAIVHTVRKYHLLSRSKNYVHCVIIKQNPSTGWYFDLVYG